MKNIRSITILLFMIIILHNIYSEDDFAALFDEIEIEDDRAGEGVKDGQDHQLQISGEHEFNFSLPYINIDRFTAPVFNNIFTIEYETEKVDIVSTWKFNISGNNIIPGENYIQLNLNSTKIKGGYNLFSWGDADLQNPTDRLNSRDYNDPLNIEKIPVLSVSVEQYFDDVSLQVVYIPVKTTSLFPFDIGDKVPEALISPESVTIKKINEIEKFVLGGKISYFGPVDLSLSYIHNYDDLYVPQVTSTGFLLTGLVLNNQRVNQIGISSKTLLGPFGIWLEANYSINEVSKNFLEWTAGFDFIFGTENQGFFNMQSFGKWTPYFIETPDLGNITDYSDKDVFYSDLLTGSLQNIESVVSLGFVAKISYKLFNEELEPELVFIYLTSLENSNTFIFKPAISYKSIDSLTFLLGMNIVNPVGGGAASSLYEEIHKNDNIFLSAKYVW
jgi:hypothetical protein